MSAWRAVIVVSVIVIICVASAAWWAWFVSRELTAVYAEGFRKAGVPEE
jgi:hypothetical protein